MSLVRRCGAEVLGTAWLVFGGCGSAVLSAAFPDVGIGLLGVSFAFARRSSRWPTPSARCHLGGGDAGARGGKRFLAKDGPAYMASQVLGAVVGAALLYLIASGKSGFDVHAGFASNGFAEHSPGGYGMGAALVAEIALTFFFLLVILGATDARAPKGFAPIAIGLCLTLIHLVGIPVTNLSVNPARSTGPAIFCGGFALLQLWLFWVGPIVGGVVAGVLYPALFGKSDDRS